MSSKAPVAIKSLDSSVPNPPAPPMFWPRARAVFGAPECYPKDIGLKISGETVTGFDLSLPSEGNRADLICIHFGDKHLYIEPKDGALILSFKERL